MSSSTRESILDVAQALAQAEGYAALSFRDVAAQVGIKSASVHYHFPTKGDLAAALVQRYSQEAKATLEALTSAIPHARIRMRAYVEGFRRALERQNRMCLCGIFAAEYDHLPEQVRAELAAFMDVNVAWLTGTLEGLQPAGTSDVLADRAVAIYAAIAGAQLTARSRSDISIYDNAIDGFAAAGLIPL